MNLKEAIEILKLHNEWRKGADAEQLHPVKIGNAIDLVTERINHLAELLEEGILYLENFDWPESMIESLGNFSMNAQSVVFEIKGNAPDLID